MLVYCLSTVFHILTIKLRSATACGNSVLAFYKMVPADGWITYWYNNCDGLCISSKFQFSRLQFSSISTLHHPTFNLFCLLWQDCQIQSINKLHWMNLPNRFMRKSVRVGIMTPRCWTAWVCSLQTAYSLSTTLAVICRDEALKPWRMSGPSQRLTPADGLLSKPQRSAWNKPLSSAGVCRSKQPHGKTPGRECVWESVWSVHTWMHNIACFKHS